MQLDAKGRADESLAVEFVGPLRSKSEDSLRNKKLSFKLQKGQLKANICYQPLQSANLEVKFAFFFLLLLVSLFFCKPE